MDGIPTLHLWDLIIDVMHLHSKQKQKDKQARCESIRDTIEFSG